MKTEQTERIVEDAITSIVSHYSQEIHLSSLNLQGLKTSKEGNVSEPDELYGVPYFDPLLGSDGDATYNTTLKNTVSTNPTLCSQPSSSIIRHWLDKLLEHCKHQKFDNTRAMHVSEDNNIFSEYDDLWTLHIQTATSLFESYHKQIRPHCFHFIQQNSLDNMNASTKRFKACKIEHFTHLVLIHYEMMVHGFMKDFNDSCTNENSGSPQSEVKSQEFVDVFLECFGKMNLIMKGLLHDISHLTCVEKVSFDEKNNTGKSSKSFGSRSVQYIVRNWILPSLLRIVRHAIQLHTIIINKLPKIMEAGKTLPIQKVKSYTQSSISHALIIATSFCSDCVADLAYQCNEATDKSQEPNATLKQTMCLSSDLHIFEILPSDFKNNVTLQHIMDTCAYSPNQTTSTYNPTQIRKFLSDKGIESDENECENIMSLINETVINYDDASISSSCTFKMNWIDNVKGIGFRAARSLLYSLEDLAIVLHHKDIFSQVGDGDQSKPRQTLIGSILHVLDTQELLDLIRANFFGRLDCPDEFSFEDDQRQKEEESFLKKMNGGVDKLAFNAITISPKTKVTNVHDDPLHDILQTRAVKQISEKKEMDQKLSSGYKPVYNEKPELTSMDEKPFVQVKSRTVSSLRLLSSFTTHHSASEVWSQSLPIIYTLIDSNQTTHQSFGGALFVHLLSQGRSFTELFCHNHDALQQNKNRSFSSVETAAKIITMCIRSCDDGATLSILLIALTHLFEIAEHTGEKISHLRNDAATNVMIWVSKHRYCGPSGEPSIVRAITANLSCGINTLLYQIAQQPNAGAVEMSRMGLSTLLPLIRWDSSSLIARTIQLAAVSSLISLMMGAYPTMKRHGGKIMAELISCVGRGLRDVKIHEEISKGSHGNTAKSGKETVREIGATKLLVAFSLHAGSVALIICERSAEEVLLRIENGNFDSSILNCCRTIRTGAWEMQQNR